MASACKTEANPIGIEPATIGLPSSNDEVLCIGNEVLQFFTEKERSQTISR
jgi:hypothetical protein